MVESTASDGVEWASDGDQLTSQSHLGWPELRSSPPDPCEGRNPMTERACRLSHHRGYHRDDTGAEWLDD
jgi:hypothetical protein